MNKQELVSTLKEFAKLHNYPLKDMIISHGGACVLLGVRDHTNDIDIYVSREIWSDHISRRFKPIVKPDGIASIQATDKISIRLGVGFMSYTQLEYDGITHQSARQTLLEYIILNRVKDRKSVNLLTKLVNSQ